MKPGAETTILYLKRTRDQGIVVCLVAVAAAYGAFRFLREGPLTLGIFCGLTVLIFGTFGVYLIWIRRRLVITLVGDELIWNTYALTEPPVHRDMREVRAYRLVQENDETASYRAVLILRSSGLGCDLGDLDLKDHRHVYQALRERYPGLEWEVAKAGPGVGSGGEGTPNG